MGNIVSYLKWRGDIEFKERTFNDVDNLILSYLSYFDFSEIVSFNDSNKITLEHAIDNYLRTPKKIKSLIKDDDEFLPLLKSSKRFKHGLIYNYSEILIDENNKVQFSALTIEYDDFIFVSYRGTDDTLAGWHEDFNLFYQIMPAQDEAVKYLNNVVSLKTKKDYYVGGHSKGGNLAVYASMLLDSSKKKKIKKIYSNDGPGISKEFIVPKKYKLIENKITKIVPEFSIIGMAFEEKGHIKIVASNEKSLMQHNILSWQVENSELILKDNIHPAADTCNLIIDEWVEGVDLNARKKFVDSLFYSIRINGATSVSDIATNGLMGFEKILHSIISDKKSTKEMTFRLLRVIIFKLLNLQIIKKIKTDDVIQGSIVFVVGVIMLAFPSLMIDFVGRLFFSLLIAYTIYKIFKIVEKKELNITVKKYSKGMLYFLLFIEILCFIFKETVLFSANTILGLIFVSISLKYYKQALIENKNTNKYWHLYLANSLISLYLGVISFALSTYGGNYHVIAAGFYFTLMGVYKIIRKKFF